MISEQIMRRTGDISRIDGDVHATSPDEEPYGGPFKKTLPVVSRSASFRQFVQHGVLLLVMGSSAYRAAMTEGPLVDNKSPPRCQLG